MTADLSHFFSPTSVSQPPQRTATLNNGHLNLASCPLPYQIVNPRVHLFQPLLQSSGDTAFISYINLHHFVSSPLANTPRSNCSSKNFCRVSSPTLPGISVSESA